MKILMKRVLLGLSGVTLSLSASALTVIADFQTTGADVGSFVSCTPGDRCGDGDGAAMTFGGGVISAKAYKGSEGQWQGAVVVQDAFKDQGAPHPWVGLGVYSTPSPYVGSDDNITFGEALEINFGVGKALTSVTLRAEGHFANFAEGSGFAISASLDGPKWYFDFVNGQNIYDVSGPSMGSSRSWFFHFASTGGEQYYVSSVTAVPEPGTYALMLAGLAGVGYMSRRRRRTD